MKDLKVFSLILVLVLLCSFQVFSAPRPYSPFSMQLNLGFDLPMGEKSQYFTYGGSAHLSGLFAFRGLPWLYIGGNIDYAMTQMQNQSLLSRAGISAQVRPGFFLFPLLMVYGFGQAGFSYSFLDIDGELVGGGSPFWTAGGGLGFFFSDVFGLNIKVAYEDYFGFYNGMYFSVGTDLRFGTGTAKPTEKRPAAEEVRPQPLEKESTGTSPGLVSIDSITFNQVFPVFYKYYDNNPVGVATIRNTGDKPIENLSLKTFINLYMDTPKVSIESAAIQPGETLNVDLFALFNNEVLKITEATKVAANISVTYTSGGEEISESKVETLRIYDRNAITWDDDRKVAAFISAKDPSVQGIAKNIAGIVTQRGSKSINRNLLMAMGIHAALPTLGLSYVIDPQTPYEELSKQENVVDFVQYPRQTLSYRAGDCDDLSVLYCSFLESVGIESAFITIPGHIYIAFATGMTSEEARKKFSRRDELIYHDGMAWVPVEITMINDGFLAAWKEGAKEWRENNAREQALIFPVREAWKLYGPTGIAAGVEGMQLTGVEQVTQNFYAEMIKFIDQEIYPQIAKIQARIRENGESAPLFNKLGVVYARYGVNDKAKEFFQQALGNEPYSPALINMGNLLYMEDNFTEALQYYAQAYELNDRSSTALLCIARTNHELENYGTVRNQYALLKTMDQDLAAQFAYLDLRGAEANRAADAAGISEIVLWDEEE